MWSLALLRGLGVNGTFGRQTDGTFGRTDHARVTLPYNVTAEQWTRWCVCQNEHTRAQCRCRAMETQHLAPLRVPGCAILQCLDT